MRVIDVSKYWQKSVKKNGSNSIFTQIPPRLQIAA
jgi:hypothetical protein